MFSNLFIFFILTLLTQIVHADFIPTTTANSFNITFPNLPVSPRAGDAVYMEVTVDQGGIYYASMELMAGNPGSGKVEDIIGYAPPPALTGVFVGFTYIIPKNVKAGTYYARLNATTIDTTGSSSNITLESDTFSVTGGVFSCLSPPVYDAISLDDPDYRSLVLLSPQAGDVLIIPTNQKEVPVNPYNAFIGWGWRDWNNNGGAGVDQLYMEFVRQVQPSINGSRYNATYASAGAFQLPANGGSFNYPYSSATLFPGEWRMRANYTNTYENNGVHTIYISEPFYVAGGNKACYGVSSSGATPATRMSSALGVVGIMGGLVIFMM